MTLQIEDKDGYRLEIEPIEDGIIRIVSSNIVDLTATQAQQIINFLTKQINND